MLEERGLPTTVLASVLPQVEKTRPPRALMTPFQLGRPLGEPNDAAFQRRVLLEALRLLERKDGPVILEHFPDDNPSWFDRPGWQPSVTLPPLREPKHPVHWGSWVRGEIGLVIPAWERFQQRFGRTTVGLAGQKPVTWASFAAVFLNGRLAKVPAHPTPALALRFLADDLKALYSEAAQADGDTPSARQIDTWFWRETLAGQLLIALRATAMESENNALKTMGSRFLVPAPYLPG